MTAPPPAALLLPLLALVETDKKFEILLTISLLIVPFRESYSLNRYS